MEYAIINPWIGDVYGEHTYTDFPTGFGFCTRFLEFEETDGKSWKVIKKDPKMTTEKFVSCLKDRCEKRHIESFELFIDDEQQIIEIPIKSLWE